MTRNLHSLTMSSWNSSTRPYWFSRWKVRLIRLFPGQEEYQIFIQEVEGDLLGDSPQQTGRVQAIGRLQVVLTVKGSEVDVQGFRLRGGTKPFHWMYEYA
ncbi:hypothetical protein EYF80_000774 [Liparis tanakae]|uniref:Uncharacterized protein n=1 Tax=Liparis tanakae TaxID=230148 RepID=A0A4Z2JF69_9TELE|nr:hypothetical protein EYF80_000774 [Liparis tanakae]